MDQNCENCRYYTDHKKGVFGGDGLCTVVRKKPKPVRRCFRKCKYWQEKEKKDDIS